MIPILNIAIRAVRKAGNIIIQGFEKINSDFNLINNFYKNEFIKKINETAKKEITKIVKSAYPYHSVIFKNISNDILKNKYQTEWIINTISGINNYIQGFPHFAISIAIKIRNRTEVAVIYDIIKNELFSAIRGKSAQINGYRLRIKKNKKNKQFIAINCLSIQNKKILMLINNNQYNINFRFTGSPALDLAYLSAGRIDAYLDTNENLDLFAGELLIKESGGIITDFDGSDNYFLSKTIVAGNIDTVKNLLIKIKNRNI